MTSTFMGLEISRRGMATQQSALYVTSQNVANASTPGYSRQRVNFEQTEPFPSPGMNQPMEPGQMGTGVKAGSIQRVREGFLDTQYRTENNKLGYWQARSDGLNQMESIMNEPSDSGLSTTMDQFWQSLQDLAADPTNSGARSVVRQRGESVAETFNYLSSSLSNVQNDQRDQIGTTVQQLNSIVQQIDQVNQQIGSVEPHGLLPNDLYDQRDRLIDELSSLVNIKVNYVSTGGNSDPKAEGKAIINLVGDSGEQLGSLLGYSGPNKLNIQFGNGGDGPVESITLSDKNVDFLKSTGKLKGLIESYGYKDANGKVSGIYPDMLNKLDQLAYTFAKNFNDVHMSGTSPYELTKGAQDIPFFADADNAAITDQTNITGFSGRIQISNDIRGNLDKIATAGSDIATATIGDSSNAYLLADVINQQYNYGQTGDKTDFRSYYQNVIGGMGVDSQQAERLTQSSTTLQQAVDERRQSVSSVSLDEEMTNMIQFQHAYSASARMITMQDQILDTIINGMGVGGR